MKLYLDPKIDFIFKKLMEDETLLLDFLRSTLRDSEGELVSAVILNPIIKKEFVKDKYSVLDVRVRTSDGREINIEIQNRDEKNMSKRTLYHWSKMFGEQIVEGENYRKLKKTICINILNFSYLEEACFHNVYRLLNKKSGNELKESTLEIHFIELPKYEKNKDSSDNEGLKAWVEFLKHPETTLATANPAIKKAVKTLEILSADEETRELYKLRQDSLLNEKLATNAAKDEGKDEATKEIAKKLIMENTPDDFIEKITGISLEEIQELKKEL